MKIQLKILEELIEEVEKRFDLELPSKDTPYNDLLIKIGNKQVVEYLKGLYDKIEREK